MYYFAFALLLAALLGSLAFAGAALIHLWQKKDGIPAFIERGHILVTGCFLMASAFLLHALYWKDYRLDYVASYTGQHPPPSSTDSPPSGPASLGPCSSGA